MIKRITIGIIVLMSMNTQAQIDLLNNNIGIGILDPEVPIHMVGDTFKIQNELGNSHFFMNKDGNIGIGRNPGGHKLDVEGVISARGKYLYLGNPSLSTNNTSWIRFRSFNSSATQIILADKENVAYGKLYGSSNGRYFGLMDADAQWVFLSDRDKDVEMRINNTTHFYMGLGSTKLRPSTLAVGWSQTGNRTAGIDFIGDDTYTSYGLRIRRYGSGPNANSQMLHRGTGGLIFATEEEANILFKNDGSTNVTIVGSGKNKGYVGIGTGDPNQKLHVNGNIQYSGSMYNASDKALKKNIEEFEYGLDEVLQLEPISYNYLEGVSDNNEAPSIGLIAQKLNEVAPSLVKSFTLPKTENRNGPSGDFLMINESAIKYMLINSIKEQQLQINEQQKMIEELQKHLDEWKGQTLEQDKIEVTLKNNAEVQVAYIMQNVPNPTRNRTSIKYFIPEETIDAVIRFYNINGSILKEVNLTERGAGIIELDLDDVISGNYMYSLIVNGQLVDTKKMAVTK